MAKPHERVLGWAFDRVLKGYAAVDAAGAERKGERLGLLAYRLDRKHRVRAEENLRLAFPEHDAAWAKATARESFLHFGRLIGDLMRAPARTSEEVLAMDVPPEARAEFEALRGQGVVICTGHLGNWERAAQWVTSMGHPLSVVVRTVEQPAIQARVERLRRASGIEILERGDAAVGMLRVLRRGAMVAVLPDQNASDAFVPFFGHPVGTVVGPAVMAKRTGSWTVSAYCLRTGPGAYRVVANPPRNLREEGMDVVEAMALYYQELEAAVRLAPEQYLWMHDRWKSARRRKML